LAVGLSVDCQAKRLPWLAELNSILQAVTAETSLASRPAG
jgi:hypothetical protein